MSVVPDIAHSQLKVTLNNNKLITRSWAAGEETITNGFVEADVKNIIQKIIYDVISINVIAGVLKISILTPPSNNVQMLASPRGRGNIKGTAPTVPYKVVSSASNFTASSAHKFEYVKEEFSIFFACRSIICQSIELQIWI